MKISLKWLHQYVDVSEFFSNPTELGDKLTRAGLEVEELTDFSKNFKNVVIGQVVTKDKHPQADKLSLCQVSTGKEVHQIVCGAQNHKAGDRVIVALPGAILPGDFQIKKSAIRGVESLGMLCSLKELGLADTSDGIAILPEEAPLGQAYADYSGLNDVTFELKVTPNRADCLSHYGLAREVSSLIGKPLKEIPQSIEFNSKNPTQELIQVQIEDAELAPRYAGRVIEKVKVGPSPVWLKSQLEAVGLKSINNIVDVTQFVMMELGQPLHAFDLDCVAGKKLRVGRSINGEVFKTLDSTDKTLTGDELVIKDDLGSSCIAGVIGGLRSGVTEKTQNIFLESAYFQAMSVRKTSRSLGVETDSAYRFSRGVDPEGARKALDRATDLIMQVAGGEAHENAYDFYPNPPRKELIKITIDFISQRLGYEVKEDLFVTMMKSLGCELKKNGQFFEVLPPSFRFDLEQDMDLVEEYARLYGYEHIPETLPKLSESPSTHDKKYLFSESISGWMMEQGFQRAFNYAFTSSNLQNDFLGTRNYLTQLGLGTSQEDIRLLNPLSEDLSVMRASLCLGLFKNMSKNYHAGNEAGRLFEVGSVFQSENQEYREQQRISALVWGAKAHLWSKKTTHALVLDLKQNIEVILKKLNISAYTWVQAGQGVEAVSFCHPGQFAALIVEGKKVGFVGTLHPQLADDSKIRSEVALMELNLDVLLNGQPRPLKIQTPSVFPLVERDFSFLKDQSLAVGELLKQVKKSAGALCVGVEVFDLFSNEQLPAGKESVTLKVWLQDKKATLSEEQLQKLQAQIIDELQKNCAVTLR